ncbi:MAG: hypothetical protein ACOYXT_05190, partial [Bacteroidota bacterium]
RIKIENEAEILDFKVLKIAREVSGISVLKDTLTSELVVDFKALEKYDGFAGQLIFEGNKESRILMEGGIDGVISFEDELASIDPLYFIIAIFIFLIASYIFLIVSRRRSMRIVPKFLFYFSALPIFYLLLMLYKTEWFIDHKVPETLRIEHYVQQTKKQMIDLPSWLK